MDIKKRIIKQATSFFKAYGVRSITMDDIAKELAMSKKTIYQYFKDKNSIVVECVKKNILEEEDEMCSIQSEVEDTMEKMFKISEHIRALLRNINPALMYDLQKYHPEAWKLHQQHMFDKTKGYLINILNQGITDGYFRSDIDVEVLATMRIYQVEMGFNTAIFPTSKFEISKLQIQLFEHFLYGICTEKGYEKIRQHKSKLIV